MASSSNEQTARTCIVCGVPADSREHILPGWLQEVLPSDDPVVHIREIGRGETERINRMGAQAVQGTDAVCRQACDNGWISRLEARYQAAAHARCGVGHSDLLMRARRPSRPGLLRRSWCFKGPRRTNRGSNRSLRPCAPIRTTASERHRVAGARGDRAANLRHVGARGLPWWTRRLRCRCRVCRAATLP